MSDEMLNSEKLLLDAVNVLLNVINEPSIEDEEDYDDIVEARQARDTIIEVKRAVLSEGWDFNTDENYIFPIDAQGFIPVPMNVLDITDKNSDIIMRNWRLYSKKNQTHVFEEEQKCDVVWDMPFDQLSHPLRHYITIRAAKVFTGRMIGDQASYMYTDDDLEDARLAARRSEDRTGQYNMLTSGLYGILNRTVRR